MSLLIAAYGSVLTDAELVQSVADKVLDAYKVEYTQQNGEYRCANKYLNWHYSTGILNSAMIEYADFTGDRKYAEYARKQAEYCLANWERFVPIPGIEDWQPFYGLRRFDELDFVGTQCGALMDIARWFDTDAYEAYIRRAAHHISNGQERLPDGTLVRKSPEKMTLWADDLYMGLSFMVRYARTYGDDAILADAVLQVDRFNEKLWDPKKKLYWHAWYSGTQTVAGAFWGRCNAWILKATSELLSVLNPADEAYGRVLAYYRRQVEGLKSYQARSGMWRQVLNNASSYEESSCTAIFAEAISMGVRRGWLDTEYAAVALKAWEALKLKIVDGELNTVCIGTGILASAKKYAARQAADGEIHGTGLILSAGMELLRLQQFMEGRNILWTRPTFCSCSVELDCPAPMENARLEYRRAGERKWSVAPCLPFYESQKGYRTSILRLEEDSLYECRLVCGNTTVARTNFFTWASDVPIGETVTIPSDAAFPVRISRKGRPDAWIRYTVEKGTVLKNSGRSATVIVDGAEYVVVDDISFEGPSTREGVIIIQNSKGVRVRNCEIKGWGRNAAPGYDELGKPVENGKRVNFDAAIRIKSGAKETVIERCYIHQPAGRSNSWYYSHPAGNEAIVLHKPDHSTVIRYNSFVGSDLHRLNDAIESEGNFDSDGGANRDADIYGNFLAFCNDDCVELDGGQRNVRCFDNRFESALVGVSVQGCMAGPSFVFDNFMSGMCDEFGSSGQTIKTGGGPHGPEARTFVSGNLMWGRGSGFTQMNTLESHLFNNVFCARQKISAEAKEGSEAYDNIFGVKIKEDELPSAFPISPCPFILSEARRTNLSDRYVLTLSAMPEMKRDVEFKVCKDDDLKWFEVNPSSGVLHPGETVELVLTLDRTLMKDRRHYRGVFIVRSDEGYSRPFTFYNETNFVPPFKAEKQGTTAVYIDPFTPESGSPEIIPDALSDGGRAVLLPGAQARALVYGFTVPKAGRYYFLVRSHSATDAKLDVDFDSQGAKMSIQRHWRDYTSWSVLAPGWKFNARIVYFDLVPGRKYTLAIKQNEKNKCEYPICGIVVTNNPGDFEPR